MDSDKVMTSDTGSDKGMSENLGHGQTSGTCVRSSLNPSKEFIIRILNTLTLIQMVTAQIIMISIIRDV